MSRKRLARLSTGAEIELDGDLVYLIDTIYREIAVKRELTHSFQDIKQEIEGLWDGMDARTRKEYFVAAVFLNYVTYENEMLDRVAEAITERRRKSGGPSCRSTRTSYARSTSWSSRFVRPIA